MALSSLSSFGLNTALGPNGLDLKALNGVPRAEAGDGGNCPATDDPVPQTLINLGLVEYTEDPTGGDWTPWFVTPGTFPVDPPPATASGETAQELVELQQIALTRTPAQLEEAEKWDSGHATKAWTELYLDLIVEHAAKTGKRNPPRLSREMAIMETALYDSLVNVWFYKYCYLRPAPSVLDPAILPVVPVHALPSYPSEHAAAAGVMSVLLPVLFPCPNPADPLTCEETPDFINGLTTNATNSRLYAGTNYRSDLDAGFALGQQVAQRVLDIRANDHAFDPTTRLRITGTCNWQPTAPAFRPTALEVQWGDQVPWIMTSGSQFRAPPPPVCDGPEYLAQYRDLFEMNLTVTDRMKEISDFWEAGQGTVTPPGMSLEIALEKTLTNGLTHLQAARVLSYVGVAVADAAIAAWDTKMHYWWDRPITAIRRLNWDTDSGMCDTVGEDPLDPEGGCWFGRASTPPFPGYVSGHSTFTGAGMRALMGFFPEDTPEFRGYSTEAALARFYGGIHFRADNDQGIEIGIKIGDLLQDRMANDGGPVPA